MEQTGAWRIEARAFPILYTPFCHDFWVLVNAAGEVADQLHGLAVDPLTGRTKAVGSSRDLLQAVRDADIRWSLVAGQPAIVFANGPADEIRCRWQAAVAAVPAINALALPYPNLWQHFRKQNSNSVFTTLGRIMGFIAPALVLGTWAPGADLVISPAIIERYRYIPPARK